MYICIYVYISIYTYIYIYISLSLSLSLSIYIYIYIYPLMPRASCVWEQLPPPGALCIGEREGGGPGGGSRLESRPPKRL